MQDLVESHTEGVKVPKDVLLTELKPVHLSGELCVSGLDVGSSVVVLQIYAFFDLLLYLSHRLIPDGFRGIAGDVILTADDGLERDLHQERSDANRVVEERGDVVDHLHHVHQPGERYLHSGGGLPRLVLLKIFYLIN